MNPNDHILVHGTITANALISSALSPKISFTAAEMPDPVPAIMQFFAYDHLPEHLQATSRIFYDMAHTICCLPNNSERAVSLRKLLEAKDAAVRAKFMK